MARTHGQKRTAPEQPGAQQPWKLTYLQKEARRRDIMLKLSELTGEWLESYGIQVDRSIGLQAFTFVQQLDGQVHEFD